MMLPHILSEEFLSSANPFLIQAEIAAAVLLGIGIVYESDKYTASIHKSAFWFVVVGIIFETVFSILLFASEERISSFQKERIVSLDKQLLIETRHATARRLPPGSDEAFEISRAMSPFAGLSVRIITYSDDHEAKHFAVELSRALLAAGLIPPWKIELASPDELHTDRNGILILNGSDEKSKGAATAVKGVLDSLHFCWDENLTVPGIERFLHPSEIAKLREFFSTDTLLIFVEHKLTLGDCK